MFKSEMQKLARKLFMLAVLVAGLGFLVQSPAGKAKPLPCGTNSALPCCSVCDDHPQYCTHGCICCGGVC
jgi:hypothetical protein